MSRRRRSRPGRQWLRRLYRLARRSWARLVQCRTGVHKPRRGRAHWCDGTWRTHCRNCGTPMRRIRKREWIVD